MCITGRFAMENTVHSLWKSKSGFPTASKQHFPQLRNMASYTHFPLAGGYGIQPISSYIRKTKGGEDSFFIYSQQPDFVREAKNHEPLSTVSGPHSFSGLVPGFSLSPDVLLSEC